MPLILVIPSFLSLSLPISPSLHLLNNMTLCVLLPLCRSQVALYSYLELLFAIVACVIGINVVVIDVFVVDIFTYRILILVIGLL